MDMPQGNLDAFSIFINWLYRYWVPCATDTKEFNTRIGLYIFAEKLCLEVLANKTMVSLQKSTDHIRDFVRIDNVRIFKMWENSSPDLPLRELCIREAVYDWCYLDGKAILFE